MNVDDVHKVTILNLPEDVSEPLDETQTADLHEVSVQDDAFPKRNDEGESYTHSSAEVCKPILPWINGDGTVNSSVYNGLRRRVFGTVVQYPGISEVHAFPPLLLLLFIIISLLNMAFCTDCTGQPDAEVFNKC